jgi:hypothetical protein
MVQYKDKLFMPKAVPVFRFFKNPSKSFTNINISLGESCLESLFGINQLCNSKFGTHAQTRPVFLPADI